MEAVALACNWRVIVPFLAWNDPNLLTLSMWCDQPRLPPLVVRRINDMQDIPIRETQALAGQAAIPRSVVVKQSSKKHKGFGYLLSWSCVKRLTIQVDQITL